MPFLASHTLFTRIRILVTFNFSKYISPCEKLGTCANKRVYKSKNEEKGDWHMGEKNMGPKVRKNKKTVT